jgi:glycerophosphoryl diester phosphodiesterase
VRFDPLPTDRWSHFSIAFAHADDSYYEHRSAQANGYHVILRANGQMAIYAHDPGQDDGQLLGAPVKTPPLTAGQWTRVSLEVTPATITWSRDGLPAAGAGDARWRGGYVHVGRSGTDGPLSLRGLQVVTMADG